MKKGILYQFEIFKKFNVALNLSFNDIRSQFRGSILGPFWSVINIVILVVILSFIYGTIFDVETNILVPHIASGLVFWFFIANCLNECSEIFVLKRDLIKNIAMPVGIYVLQVIIKNTIILIYHLIALVPFLIFYEVNLFLNLYFVLIGFIFNFFLLYTFGYLIAFVSAIFRDIPHIIKTINQMAIFVTPIIYTKEMLGSRFIIADVNPFYHIIEIMRSPLLNKELDLLNWTIVISSLIIIKISVIIFGKYIQDKTPYYI